MKTIKVLLTFILISSVVHSASGCLNLSGTTLDGGKTHRRLGNSAKFLQQRLDMDLKTRAQEMEELLRGGSNITNLNDFAVALVFAGRNDEAIRLLEELEKESPGNYATAANLGTAYELAGKNTLALKWIQEGIRRDSESHQGTEWVHVKILEAKLQHEQNPDYFKTHSVLGIEPKRMQERDVVLKVGKENLNAKEVANAIHYQLIERLQFVKKADAAVASLLFDYGILEASVGTVENARELLAMAVKFGYPENRVLPLYARFDQALRVRRIKQYVLYGSIGFGAVGFIIYAVKRRWITVR